VKNESVDVNKEEKKEEDDGFGNFGEASADSKQ
jgi:hypothetical protein